MAEEGKTTEGGEDGEKLDRILGHMDSLHAKHDAMALKTEAHGAKIDALCSRMDAMESAMNEGGMADKAKADKAKADAAEKEEKEKEEKAKADKAKADSEEVEKAKADAAASKARADALEARLADMDKRIPAQLPDEQRALFAAEQAKAERVHQAFGDSAGAPHWMNGETRTQYVARLASKFKDHSKSWKSVDLNKLPEDALAVAAERIYADAMDFALHPSDVAPGTLRMIPSKDDTGRVIKRFAGDIKTTFGPFMQPVRHLVALAPRQFKTTH